MTEQPWFLGSSVLWFFDFPIVPNVPPRYLLLHPAGRPRRCETLTVTEALTLRQARLACTVFSRTASRLASDKPTVTDPSSAHLRLHVEETQGEQPPVELPELAPLLRAFEQAT